MPAIRRARRAELAVLAVICSEFSATIFDTPGRPRPRPIANNGIISSERGDFTGDPHKAPTAAHNRFDRGNAPARVVTDQTGIRTSLLRFLTSEFKKQQIR